MEVTDFQELTHYCYHTVTVNRIKKDNNIIIITHDDDKNSHIPLAMLLIK